MSRKEFDELDGLQKRQAPKRDTSTKSAEARLPGEAPDLGPKETARASGRWENQLRGVQEGRDRRRAELFEAERSFTFLRTSELTSSIVRRHKPEAPAKASGIPRTVYVLTKTLAAPVLLHATNNAVAVGIVKLQGHLGALDERLQDLPLLLVAAAAIALIALVVLLYQQRAPGAMLSRPF